MAVSLFNKYRPQTFGDLVGQKSATEIITNSITKSSTGHAYLFSGSRGCGKTSAARIFAKALNCKSPNGFEPCGKCSNCTAITAGESLDVIEIDGASNNGVENIRGLKENVTLAPFNSRWKIYIIDEVHMLSTGAFNALLKTLEEPPEYVIFIMATTEPQKVPVTIRSRCQHIPFHSIQPEDIYSRLKYVCEHENVSAENEALWEISRQADGALRDALSLLEQVIAAGDVTLPNVERVTGAGSRTSFECWVSAFRSDPSEGYMMLKAMFDSGASGLRVFEEMFSLIRNLWLISRWKNIAGSLGASEQEKSFMNDEVSHWKSEDLHRLLNVIVKILSEARRGIKPDILLGMFMLYLEPAQEISQPVIIPARIPEVKPTPKPIVQPEIIPSVKNSELKEKVLDVIHDSDFVIYSAVLDSDVYVSGDDLRFRFNHAYCYTFMKAARRAADLRGMFNSYKSVVLSYGNDEYICPNYDEAIKIESAPVNIPVKENVRELATESVIVPERETVPLPEITPQENEHSSIGKLIGELIRYNAKPEVLMIRKNESESEDDNNNSDEGENDE